MWPDRRICQLFGIEHPIVQAPMAGSSTTELAMAVSEAGGLGSLACASLSPDQIEAEAGRFRAGSNRPFNMNLFAHRPGAVDPASIGRLREQVRPWYRKLGLDVPEDDPPPSLPGFDDARLELLLRLRPRIASFHFGVPAGEAMAALKQAGILVISTASTVAEAQALEKAGVSAVIAQGWEAGGHRGSHVPTAPFEGVGTMALVPQVVNAVSVPVIAAGGIGDGRGIAAAFALGASGVQMGTAFLSCPEAATDEARRARLRAARDTDTMVTDFISGRSARTMRSRFTEAMEANREARLPFPMMCGLSYPLVETAADDEANFHLYGQAASLNVEQPARDVVDRLVRETARVFQRLSGAGT